MSDSDREKAGRRALVAWPVAIALLVIMVAVCLVPWDLSDQIRWLIVLACMVGFFAVLGWAFTGHLYGIILSDRNVLSLSRFQALLWSVVILSTYLVVALGRVREGFTDPWVFEVPRELVGLIGVAGGGAVAANGFLSRHSGKALDTPEKKAMMTTMGIAGAKRVKPADLTDGLLRRNTSARYARASNLLTGDFAANRDQADFTKVQLFFFTLVTLIVFAAATWQALGDDEDAGDGGDGDAGPLDGLPGVPGPIVEVLGVSQVGYVAGKGAERRPR